MSARPLPVLVPLPKSVRLRRDGFDLARHGDLQVTLDAARPDSAREAARTVAAALALAAGRPVEIASGNVDESAARLTLAPRHPGSCAEQSYRLDISHNGIHLTGGGEAGLFHGAQTLAQIAGQAVDGRLPALRIDDTPDYPVRGFYHDIARGKVPTRATLFALIETLARYKINQLQLYIEHTFAFARHPDIWAGSDPLTADDIRAIDDHAARHHIELVPSLSTFGHFYTGLVSPRKSHLNELEVDAARLPFSWWDRMGHYTLDCRHDESLALVREMILELRPLFHSRLFNLCCDETFDLGKGKNAAEAARSGTGRLYLDFLQKLIAVVRETGCTPMFWGDIVGNHSELVAELPRDVIALDWDYSAELKDTKSRLFRKAGVPFYACPGVTGWDRWVNDLDTATTNITAFAARGRRDGAIGLLNTDWGDRGHVNALGNSLHGLILGAAAGWNTRGTATDVDAFDRAVSQLEYGDASGEVVALMREAGRLNVVSWRLFTLWLDPTPHRPASWWDERTGLPMDLLTIDPRVAFSAAKRLLAIEKRLGRLLHPNRLPDPLAGDEFRLGCRGSSLFNVLGAHLICLAKGKTPPRGAPALLDVTNDLRHFEADFSAIWHARNRPSEYWRLRTAWLEIARRAELAALHGIWVRTTRPGL